MSKEENYLLPYNWLICAYVPGSSKMGCQAPPYFCTVGGFLRRLRTTKAYLGVTGVGLELVQTIATSTNSGSTIHRFYLNALITTFAFMS